MAKGRHITEGHKKTGECLGVFEARQKLYSMMKEIVYATRRGYENDDYTKTINLRIGTGTLSYDPYYQKLTYYDDKEGCEYGIGDDDFETVQVLLSEIQQRFAAFEKKVSRTRNKAASECFDVSINTIIRGCKND